METCKMIDPELGFDKISFSNYIRRRKRFGTLPKHLILLAESIPNWKWEFYNFISMDEFIQWCKDNNINSGREYKEWMRKNKKPSYIPFRPHNHYEEFTWSILSGFYPNRDYCTKEEFIQWCKDREIKDSTYFINWCKENQKPDNIPSSPNKIYENFEWGDISGRYMNVEWSSEKEFIKFCKKNKIRTRVSFDKWCKKNQKPKGIPSNPERVYEDWEWGNLSGVFYKNVNWYSMDEFIKFCKDRGIKNQPDFIKWCRENQKPKGVIYNPQTLYENWSWSILSGNKYKIENCCTKKEFIQWCKDHGIRTKDEYTIWCKENTKPENIPCDPYYIKEWKWKWSILSGCYYRVNWISKDEFIKFCKDRGIKNSKSFKEWCKKNTRPYNVPSQPNTSYDDFSWGDISGKYYKVKWISKKEFIQWCKKNKLKVHKDFLEWMKKHNKPNNIPYSPYSVYDNFSWSEITKVFSCTTI